MPASIVRAHGAGHRPLATVLPPSMPHALATPSRPPNDRAEHTEIVAYLPTDPPPQPDTRQRAETVVIAEQRLQAALRHDRERARMPAPTSSPEATALIAIHDEPSAPEYSSVSASGIRPKAPALQGDSTPAPAVPEAPASLRGSWLPPAPSTSSFASLLRADELGRAKIMLRIMAVASAIGAMSVAIRGLTTLLEQVATGALVLWCSLSVWLSVVVSLFDNISRRQHVAAGWSAIAALALVMALTGPQSALVAALVVLVAHYAATERRFEAWSSYGLAAFSLLALACLSAGGALPIPADPWMWISVLIGEALLVVALWSSLAQNVARQREREREHNRVARREALLDEAYASLDALSIPRLGALSGKTVAGYSVREHLGGAERPVFAAQNTSGDEVAIKLLSHRSAKVDRVFRDALIAASVTPVAVGVRHHGALPSGMGYLITERVHGRDLASILREPEALTRPQTLSMIERLAEGLSAVHSAGAIHGNLEPENILRDRHGRWRIVDFGSAVLALSPARQAPRYLAPEMLAGASVDPRADVFSLGALAYRALTRCPAFCGADPFESGAAGPFVRPARPSSISPVHEDVDRVMALALSSDPDARIESVTAFAAALRDAEAGQLSDWLRVRADALMRVESWAR